MNPAEPWRDELSIIIKRLRAVVDERFGSIPAFSEFLREHEIDPSSPRTLHDYLNPDVSKNKPDLEWLLKVADTLNIDYPTLFRGGKTGWELVPTERYKVYLPGEIGSFEFKIPKGWRQHMDFAFRDLPIDRDVRVRLERVEGEKVG